jgi:hypothetical protein
MRKIFSTIIAMTLIIVIASNATTIIVQANSTETPTTLDPLIIPMGKPVNWGTTSLRAH